MRAVYTILPVILFLLLANLLSAQQAENQNTGTTTPSIQSYFAFDRENIHLHLNKNIYVSDDKIWFKGYVIEKKSELPYFGTSNTYVQLLSSDGKLLDTKLIFTENSTFDGYFAPGKNFSSGTYYLRAYTNYMNNFDEDESAVAKFTFINTNSDSYIDTREIDFASAKVDLFPESGVFLEGVNNTIAVRITDCHGTGIPTEGGVVKDAAGKIISTFTTNSQGYGKFDIVSANFEAYKAITHVNGTAIESALPIPLGTGFTFNANNFGVAGKTIVTLKTNKRTLQGPAAKYSLFIQKNSDAVEVDIPFSATKTEHTIVLNTADLPVGIVNLILARDSKKTLAQRVVFNPPPQTKAISVENISRRNDSIYISGLSPLLNADLSISVLPASTRSDQMDQPIESSLLFNNYLTSPVLNAGYYLNELTRARRFELDNLLITKQSKYTLEKMSGPAPVEKYDFDRGLTIKGTINGDLPDRENYHVKMEAAILDLYEFSRVDAKNEFTFEHIVAVDSTLLFFTLVNRKSKPKKLQLYSRITNNNRQFVKPFNPIDICPPGTGLQVADDFTFPKIKGVILVDTVTIVAKTRAAAEKHLKVFNNSMSRGFKLTDADRRTYRDLLSFIRFNGFDVSTEAGNVIIRSRSSGTFRGSTSPLVFVDDSPVTDFSMLNIYNMDEIDEIYINKHGYGAGMDGANGVIRIYTRLPPNGKIPGVKINSLGMTVKNGYQWPKIFTNPQYASYTDTGFKNYGTISWDPHVLTDETGKFNLRIPNMGQKSVRLLIEGISSTGELFSQSVIVDIP